MRAQTKLIAWCLIVVAIGTTVGFYYMHDAPRDREPAAEAVADDPPPAASVAELSDETSTPERESSNEMPALINDLSAQSPTVRIRAAEALGRLGPAAEPAIEPLCRLLTRQLSTHEEQEFLMSYGGESQAAAARALVRIGAPARNASLVAFGERLAQQEESPYNVVSVKRVILESVVELGPTPALLDELKRLAVPPQDSGDAELQVLAVRAIGLLGAEGRPAVEELIAAMGNYVDERVRVEAAATLGKIGPGAVEAIPRLLDLLSEYWPLSFGDQQEIDREAARIEDLDAAKEKRAELVALRTKGTLRETAAASLEKIDPNWRDTRQAEAYVQSFLESLPTTVPVAERLQAIEIINPAWRTSAAATEIKREFVRRLADASLAEGLVRSLDLLDQNWRQSTVAKEELPGMVHRLADTDDARRQQVCNALSEIDAKWQDSPFLEDVVAIQTERIAAASIEDPQEALKALCLLGELGTNSQSALADVQPLLGHKNPQLRQTTAWVLGRIGSAARVATDPLLERIEDEELPVRQAAAGALDQLQPDWASAGPAQQALHRIVSVLQSPDGETRLRSVSTVQLFGPQAAKQLDTLLPMVLDPVSEVSVAALRALDSIEPQWPSTPAAKALVPQLIDALPTRELWAFVLLRRIDLQWNDTEAAARATERYLAVLGDPAVDDVRPYVIALSHIERNWERSLACQPVRDEYRRRLEEGDMPQRLASVRALTVMAAAEREVSEAMIRLLSGDSIELRTAAADALREMPFPSDFRLPAIMPLVECLASKEARLQIAAARTLRKIGKAARSDAEAPLTRLRDDSLSSAELREAAASAVEAISGRAIVP